MLRSLSAIKIIRPESIPIFYKLDESEEENIFYENVIIQCPN